jgi:hypothetical protein
VKLSDHAEALRQRRDDALKEAAGILTIGPAPPPTMVELLFAAVIDLLEVVQRQERTIKALEQREEET